MRRAEELGFARAWFFATTFTATEEELKARIAALADAGCDEIALQIVPGEEHAIEDWGRIRRAFARRFASGFGAADTGGDRRIARWR